MNDPADSRPTAWAFVLVAASLVWFGWATVQPVLLSLVRIVDGFAFNAYNTISTPLFGFRSSPVPMLAPLVIGLMASTAPCQLSTGTASVAFVAQDGQPGGALRRGLAFVLGRVLMYAIFGGIVMFALGGTLQAPGPLLSTIRKVIGPLTVLVGLVTLGWLPFRLQLGSNLSERFKGFSETRDGTLGALLLGIAFSFAFCPTLFLFVLRIDHPTRADCTARFRVPGRLCHRHGLAVAGIRMADLKGQPNTRFARRGASLETLADPAGGRGVRARRGVRYTPLLAHVLTVTFGITTLGQILSQSAGNQKVVFSSETQLVRTIEGTGFTTQSGEVP